MRSNAVIANRQGDSQVALWFGFRLVALFPICTKKVHSKYYLVASVTHIQSIRSQIYVYIYTFSTI
jgi:hypothetical protein